MENILVIGGGLMGSSVAWKLAEQGAKVTLLEQQGKDFDHGSSYGAARISRSLGPKKDVFSFAHNRTVKEVKKLLKFLNKKKKGNPHKIEDIYSTSPVSYLYTRDQYDQIDKLRYKKQRRDYRRGSGDSAFRKFGMTLQQNEVLVREYKEHSGTLDPHELIQKLRLGIGKKGGKIVFNKKVTNLVKNGNVFELEVLNVKTNKTKKIKAKKVVLAVGPYTNEVLKNFAPYFNRLITPKRVLVSYFKIAEERHNELSKKELESIVAAQPMFSQVGDEYFSMIERWEDGQPIFKVGLHKKRHNVIDVDKAWNLRPRKREIKSLKKKFRKYFDKLEIYLDKKQIEDVGHCNCLYSMTRSGVPLVTNIYNRHGSLDHNIVVIGGMSGVGAKGCLAYGTIGANLILGNPEEPSKIYRKAAKAFGNYGVRLYTRRPRRGRLF